MWRFFATLSRCNPKAAALMEEGGRPYVLLRPPTVSVPLIAHGYSENFQRGCWVKAAEFQDGYNQWEANCSILDADALRAAVPDTIEEYYLLPDRDDLLECKRFAEVARTQVVMYGAETFGGSPEFEWAWHFGGDEDRIFILISPTVVLEVTRQDVIRHPYRNGVFGHSAKHLGVDAPGGVFRPFYRKFPFDDYLVIPNRPPNNPA